MMAKQELWEEVLEHGWNQKRIRAFLRAYGSLVRGCILYHLRHYGNPNALARELRAMEPGASSRTRAPGVPGEWLDLAQEIWQGVWLEIFTEGAPRLQRYRNYQERQQQEGKSARTFDQYLKGLVWHIFLRRAEDRPGRRSLPWVAPPPKAEDPEAWLEAQAASAPEPTPVGIELDAYWDQLLRCLAPEPDRIEQELIRLRREPDTVLCWACAALKRELEGRQRENLLAFVAFFCSQRGPQRSGPRLEDLQPQTLNLEVVAGRYWRWEEDICRLFGKQIRKDRVMRQIQECLKKSRYRDLVSLE
jgi:hypothetical protein